MSVLMPLSGPHPVTLWTNERKVGEYNESRSWSRVGRSASSSAGRPERFVRSPVCAICERQLEVSCELVRDPVKGNRPCLQQGRTVSSGLRNSRRSDAQMSVSFSRNAICSTISLRALCRNAGSNSWSTRPCWYGCDCVCASARRSTFAGSNRLGWNASAFGEAAGASVLARFGGGVEPVGAS